MDTYRTPRTDKCLLLKIISSFFMNLTIVNKYVYDRADTSYYNAIILLPEFKLRYYKLNTSRNFYEQFTQTAYNQRTFKNTLARKVQCITFWHCTLVNQS